MMQGTKSMSVRLISRVVANETIAVIQFAGHIEIRRITKPLFPGDRGTVSIEGVYASNDAETAKSEFNLICEAARS